MLTTKDTDRMIRTVQARYHQEQENKPPNERLGWKRIMEKVVEEAGYHYPESQEVISKLATEHAKRIGVWRTNRRLQKISRF